LLVDKLEIHFVVENFVSDQVLEGRDKKLIYLTLAWIDWARVCVISTDIASKWNN